MISEHQRYLKTRKEIITEKDNALEILRIKYLEDCERVMRKYTRELLRFSQTGQREESHV